MRLRSVAGAMAIAAAAIATTPGNAFADAPPGGGTWDYQLYVPGADVYIEKYGDIVMLCDNLANGYAASATVSWDSDADSGYYNMRASGGSGSCVTRSASSGYNLPENIRIYISYQGGNTIRTAWWTNDR